MVRHAIPRCQPLRPCEEAAMVGGGHVIVSHGHTRDMKVLILREQPVAINAPELIYEKTVQDQVGRAHDD